MGRISRNATTCSLARMMKELGVVLSGSACESEGTHDIRSVVVGDCDCAPGGNSVAAGDGNALAMLQKGQLSGG